MPEVLGEELRADGLPIDADPLTHLHQVGRAAGRPEVIRTPCPRAPAFPYPLVRPDFWTHKADHVTVLLKTLLWLLLSSREFQLFPSASQAPVGVMPLASVPHVS